MPSSQIFPASPSLSESIRLFYVQALGVSGTFEKQNPYSKKQKQKCKSFLPLFTSVFSTSSIKSLLREPNLSHSV